MEDKTKELSDILEEEMDRNGRLELDPKKSAIVIEWSKSNERTIKELQQHLREIINTLSSVMPELNKFKGE